MRYFRSASLMLALLLFAHLSFGQDFSNKGKDFWVGYGYHERMAAGGGGSQDMVLYFATEAATNVTVTIPGNGYSRTYSIPANTIYTSAPIPKTGINDARLNQEAVFNRGIHITADKPIVAYAHIYNASVSGATLLFPTNTLGREYYSVNYDQTSNTDNANSWFYAIAVDPGVTTVEITPSQPTLTRAAGVPFTVNLNQGEIINMMGQLKGNSGDEYYGVDLTGSKIRSISTGAEGCKRLAVFSGSGRISLVCNGVGSGQKSSDNYMVQAFPKTAWGKTYLTVPTQVLDNNVYRIAVDDPTTVVRVNGQVISGLINNFYYQIGPFNYPAKIEADKPVMVAQYISTGRFCGNNASGNIGDPEVIYLSPIEQTINKVILNSTHNFQISQHYVNVTIPNSGTAISSFRLDGQTRTGFTPHPQNPQYSYARFSVNAGQHILESDSGFNAVAYGYGDYESYGYNAGANVKDLYQFVTVENQFATVDFPAACKGAPFELAMTFPYQPTRIEWKFNGLFTDVTETSPVASSSTVVNGRTLYKYKLPGTYSTPTVGTYPIKIIAENPTSDGCNGVQEIDYDLEVFDNPKVDFNFSSNGCVNSPVRFNGTIQNNNGRPAQTWSWNFGNGNTDNSGSTVDYTFNTAGTYNVQYSLITDVGCKSDTITKSVVLNDPPFASFAAVNSSCVNAAVNFTDQSTSPAGTTITKWTWSFGDGTVAQVATTGAPVSHVYTTPGTYLATLQVETASGCVSTVFSRNIIVHPNPTVAFAMPNVVCLPSGSASFINQSTISDGSEASFQYTWNFGDGSPIATVGNPTHQFQSAGPFTVSLSVQTAAGCTGSSTQIFNNIYEEPQAAFSAASEVCVGNSVQFTDQSTAANAVVESWIWDFGDGTFSNQASPSKTYATPGTYTVTLHVSTDKGCQTIQKFASRQIQVRALPVADFTFLQTACEGREVEIRDMSSAVNGTISKWNWNFGNNQSEVRTTSDNFKKIYAQTGTYNINLQVETALGCVSEINSKTIQVHPNPIASFDPASICVSDITAPFNDASTIAAGSVASWLWNFGDANASVAGNQSTLQNATHHYSLPGVYTTTLIAGSAEGCKDTTQRTFTVNGALLTPSFTIQNNGAICANELLTIKDNSQIDAGKIVRVVIQWDINDASAVEEDLSPYPGKLYQHVYPLFTNPASKNYRVRYQVYSGIVCVDTYEQDITVLARPALSFLPQAAMCSNADNVALQVTVNNNMPGIGTYFGQGVSSAGIFQPAVATAGDHLIEYIFNAQNGCSDTIQQTITVHPTPQTNAGPDKVVLEGGVVELTPELITGYPVIYSWSPVVGLDNASIANPKSSPSADQLYTLTITSEFGCSTSDDVFVKLLRTPVIPNIFSPNGDGINDRWVIEHLDSYPGCVVEIFNRYGQQVHQIRNYSTPWDGRINGKDAPVGTYYYIIDPKNGRKPITGFVDIIR